MAPSLSLVFQDGWPEDINDSGMIEVDDILVVLKQVSCTGT